VAGARNRHLARRRREQPGDGIVQVCRRLRELVTNLTRLSTLGISTRYQHRAIRQKRRGVAATFRTHDVIGEGKGLGLRIIDFRVIQLSLERISSREQDRAVTQECGSWTSTDLLHVIFVLTNVRNQGW